MACKVQILRTSPLGRTVHLNHFGMGQTVWIQQAEYMIGLLGSLLRWS